MKHCGLVALAFAAAAVLFPATSSAEIRHGTDGTFCTAKGYLAFDDVELERQGAAAAIHVLKLFRFGSGRGIYFAGRVNLPKNLSVGWMTCGGERVTLGGAVVRSWPEKCIVEINRRGEIAGAAT